MEHDLPKRPWLALVFIALAQLMAALDATIVSVALPTVQRAMGFSDAGRQWVITAYTLSFGGLLLLGGRLADVMGRRRAFLVGLAGFAAASALGGAATSFAMLLLARALQGAFGALLSPTALSLLAVTFTEKTARAKAFAVYGGVAGSGGVVGLVLGGWLTELAQWRWCFYVNLLFAAVAFIGARATLSETQRTARTQLDGIGAALVTLGVAAVVYGCSGALPFGWSSPVVLGRLAVGLVLLALFVVRQRSAPAPLLPLHVILDRRRGGASIAAALAIIAMFGLFLLLTYYFQIVRHFSPMRAGFAFLPMSAAGLFGSTVVASRLLPRIGPRVVMVGGLLVAAAGMAWLTQMGADVDYLRGIVPGEVAVGFGIGCAMISAFSVATQGVAPREAGVASAAITTAQQVGGSIGTALLNTVAAAASAAYLAEGGARTDALVHGYSRAAAWGCGILLVAAGFAGALVTAGKPLVAPPR